MKRYYINLTDFCKSHYIEEAFIRELFEYELVSLKMVDEQPFLLEEELPNLEKMVRMHRDLQINIAGIDAIQHLLQKTESLQTELSELRKQLLRHGDS